MVFLFFLVFWSGDPPVVLGPDNLLELAGTAFERGPGRAFALQRDALQDARNLTGGRFESLSVNALPEISARNGERGEHNLQVEANMPLANLPKLIRDVLSAEDLAAQQAARVERLQFVLDVQTAFADAFLADTLYQHVTELYEQAAEQEKALAEQVDRQLGSKPDWFAQKALAGEYAHEMREMDHRRQSAIARLERLLGRTVKPNFSKDLKIVEDGNPFAALQQQTTLFPGILLAGARAETARRKARLTQKSNGPNLAPNLNYRDESDGNRWLGVGVKLSFSLRPTQDSTWRMNKAAAETWEARRQWQASQLQATLAGRQSAYDRNRQRALSFEAEVLSPLKQQAELYGKALEKGHLERRFWLQSQRELHEAEHEYLLLVHGLWADRMEARILELMTEEGASL